MYSIILVEDDYMQREILKKMILSLSKMLVMEEYGIYAIVLLALFYLYKKTFGKNAGCGCSGNSKCNKK